MSTLATIILHDTTTQTTHRIDVLSDGYPDTVVRDLAKHLTGRDIPVFGIYRYISLILKAGTMLFGSSSRGLPLTPVHAMTGDDTFASVDLTYEYRGIVPADYFDSGDSCQVELFVRLDEHDAVELFHVIIRGHGDDTDSDVIYEGKFHSDLEVKSEDGGATYQANHKSRVPVEFGNVLTGEAVQINPKAVDLLASEINKTVVDPEQQTLPVYEMKEFMHDIWDSVELSVSTGVIEAYVNKGWGVDSESIFLQEHPWNNGTKTACRLIRFKRVKA